jgi:hypothetical protein
LATGDDLHVPTPTAYGDSADGTGPLLASLHAAGIDPRVKIQAAVAPCGHFSKDQFQIDLAAGSSPAPPSAPPRSSTTPTHATVTTARPASAPPAPPARCTSAAAGRTITITAYEHELAAARTRQADPDLAADYRATRPKVERKLADLVRRRQRVGDQDPLVGQEGDAREGEQRERQDDEGNRPAAHTVEGTDRGAGGGDDIPVVGVARRAPQPLVGSRVVPNRTQPLGCARHDDRPLGAVRGRPQVQAPGALPGPMGDEVPGG